MRPYSTRSALLPVAMLAALAWVPIAAQDRKPREVINSLVRQLRDPEFEAQRATIADRLLEFDEAGARALFSEARLLHRDARKQFAKEAKRQLAGFRKRAARLVGKRLRGQDDEISRLRQLVRKLSTSPELTKKQIQTQADPAFDQLERLVATSIDEVLTANPDLSAAQRELELGHRRCVELFEIEDRAADALVRSKSGQRYLRSTKPSSRPHHELTQLRSELDFAAWLATPMSRRDASTLEANLTLSEQFAEAEEPRGIRALNRRRLILGRSAIAIDAKLCDASRDHSADMQKLGFFSHTSPVPGKKSPSDRAARAGTSGGAENIAVGTDSGSGAIRMWWYSPGHHRNMMGNHARVGLGRSGRHWTQMFGG